MQIVIALLNNIVAQKSTNMMILFEEGMSSLFSSLQMFPSLQCLALCATKLLSIQILQWFLDNHIVADVLLITSFSFFTDLIANLTFRKLFFQENVLTKELLTENYIMPLKNGLGRKAWARVLTITVQSVERPQQLRPFLTG